MSADGADSSDDVMFSGGGTVTLSEFMASGLFQRTYREGMQLVEETSAYLDGPGREAARTLSREASLAYAGESMRLTTRLMQVAAWLLGRKAVHEGEITAQEASAEKYPASPARNARTPELPAPRALPVRLLELVERSERLYARVERLDTQLRERPRPSMEIIPWPSNSTGWRRFFHETLTREFGLRRGE